MTSSLRVNGQTHRVEAAPETPLLTVLRNDLSLNAAKFGCGLGQCGACTVLADGTAIRSCTTPLEAVEGMEIVTLEGLGTPGHPHPLQKAFIEQQAMQCGYCANGMIMTAAALLDSKATLSKNEIKSAMSGNLCRCGAHPRILAAILQAMEATP